MSVDVAIAQGEQEEVERHVAIDAAMQGWSPRGDKVVLAKIRPTERKLESGIVLPGKNSVMGDKVERKGIEARVVAVGPDATLEVNDRVFCSSFAGSVVEIGGHGLLVIIEGDLLLVEAKADRRDLGTMQLGASSAQ